MPMPKPLKTIRSHSGHARFLAECDWDDDSDLVIVREVVRQENIPSPYAYSPGWPVYRWKGREILVREVGHRCFMVFDAASMQTYVDTDG